MEKPFNPTTTIPQNITTMVVLFALPTAWYLWILAIGRD
jgi:hypothetical protein